MPIIILDKKGKSKILIVLISLLLIGFLSFFILGGKFIGQKTKISTPTITIQKGANYDLKKVNGVFQKTIYGKQVNVLHNGKYVNLEDYLNISVENGRIKLEDLDGNVCYIGLDYKLKNALQIASPSISINKKRGYYYFTTDIGKEVNSVAYKIDCPNAYFKDNILYMNNYKIDFRQAEEQQNISTKYNLSTKKLEFSIIKGKSGNLKMIDPTITYNGTTYNLIDVYIRDNDVTSDDNIYASQIKWKADDLLDDIKVVEDIRNASLEFYVIYENSTATGLNISRIENQTWHTVSSANEYKLHTKKNTTKVEFNQTLANYNWVKMEITDIYKSSYVNNEKNFTVRLEHQTDALDTTNTWTHSTTGRLIHGVWWKRISFESRESSISQYPRLTVEYYGIAINKPSNNDEILNTLDDTLNISVAGYNQTVWYTLNDGVMNYTICSSADSCGENETTITFPHQGYFNLTVYANKSSDSSIASKTVTNLFVGNNTFLNQSYNMADLEIEDTSADGDDNAIIMRWNISEVTGNNYDEIIVIRANLSMYYNASLGPPDNDVSMYRIVNQTWDETITATEINSFTLANNTNTTFDTASEGNFADFNIASIIEADVLLKNNYSSVWLEDKDQLVGDVDTIEDGAEMDFGDTDASYFRYDSREKTTISTRPYLNITYYTPNSPPNTPVLITPEDLSSQAYNNSVFFNFTVTDPNSDNMTLNLFADTNPDPTTIINSTINYVSGSYYTFNWTVAGGHVDGTYYWKVYAQDDFNQQNVSSAIYSFKISTVAPSINLNYPANEEWFNNGTNIYFNITAEDADGLTECNLYSNWTGTWHMNESFTSVTSGVQFYTIKNLSEGGYYVWNVNCSDSLGNVGYSLNKTMGVDLTKPHIVNITEVTTTTGSQTITFDNVALDALSGVDTCKYSIYNSSGGIDGLYSNVSVNCGANDTSATVSAYGTYTLELWALDKAGNENSTTKEFTVLESVGAGGGGGVKKEIIVEEKIIEAPRCGDGKCDRERNETFYNCPEDCAIDLFKDLNLDTLLFNCISKDPEKRKECLWVKSPGLWFIFLFITSFMVFGMLFELKPKIKDGKKRWVFRPRRWWEKRRRRY